MSDETNWAPRAPQRPDQITYGSYLKVDELLQLQQFESNPPMHDELLFITIHQAYELWFKQILFELDSVVERLKMFDIYEARRLVQRVVEIEKLLVNQIHILETMMPRDFASFRSALNPASGFQSVQFREVEFLSGIRDASVMKGIRLSDEERARLQRRLDAPSVQDIFYDMLQHKGYDVVSPDKQGNWSDKDRARTQAALLEIYEHPEIHFHVYNLAESLVEHDQCILMWRFHHVRVVERLIGMKPGTGGSHGVKYLASTLSKRAYPLLWETRAYLEDAKIYGVARGMTTPLEEEE